MQLNLIKKISFLLTSIVLLWGCGDLFTGKTTEGVIEYEVTYPSLEAKSAMTAGLPDKATFKFKGDRSITELSGAMGLVKMCYISDSKNNSIKQTLNLLDKKYVSEVTDDYKEKMRSDFIASVTEEEGEKIIAGYKCKKANVKLNDGTIIEMYYTNDLGRDNINWSNPYHDIKGALMEFYLKKYGITMKMTATAVKKETVSDEDFIVPADYKKINVKEQDKILEELNPVQE